MPTCSAAVPDIPRCAHSSRKRGGCSRAWKSATKPSSRLHVASSALDDATRNFHEGFVADFQALEEPARFLELCAHRGMPRAAAKHVGITLVEAYARERGTIYFDSPATIGAADEHVGHDVFGLGAADGCARTRVQATHQRNRLGQLVVRGRQTRGATA